MMLKENLEITNLKTKVVGIVVDISTLQNSRQDKLANASKTKEVQHCSMTKCKICGPKFDLPENQNGEIRL